ncbi:MAG: response regulator [Bacillota bacterium]|nr:response regulator [Bacillota bacterium]
MPSLLLVDDSNELLEILDRFFSALGYRCAVAGSAREAASALQAGGAFDVAVVDLMMSGTPGTSVIGLCKERAIPVIVLTGLDTKSAWKICGPDMPVMTKPADLFELDSVIKQTIASRQHR